jgi:hypothetical protein
MEKDLGFVRGVVEKTAASLETSEETKGNVQSASE